MTVRALLAATCLAAAACGGTEPEPTPAPTFEGNLTRSRGTFTTESALHGDNYRYTRFDSSWTGSWTRTEIEVTAGVVTGRIIEEGRSENGIHEPDSRVEERGASLGREAGGHPLKTIPELYDECENEVMTKDPAAHDITVRFYADGILAVCIFVPKGCVDDCTQGPRIDAVTFL